MAVGAARVRGVGYVLDKGCGVCGRGTEGKLVRTDLLSGSGQDADKGAGKEADPGSLAGAQGLCVDARVRIVISSTGYCDTGMSGDNGNTGSDPHLYNQAAHHLGQVSEP